MNTEGSGYLWDRSGEPDAEMRDLEARLAHFRFAGLWIAAGDGIMRTAHDRYEESPAPAPERERT